MQPEPQQHFGFQARLGAAYMGVVDGLKESDQLGTFLLHPDAAGNWLRPTMQAERISCYVGVLAAYSRFLYLAAQPHVKQRMMDVNGNEAAEACIAGVARGKEHASIEIKIFINRIAAVNNNFASRQFVADALARGLLHENDAVVQSFRQVASDPFYPLIAEACRGVNQAVHAAGQTPHLFWFRWAEETKLFYANIEQRFANCTDDGAL